MYPFYKVKFKLLKAPALWRLPVLQLGFGFSNLHHTAHLNLVPDYSQKPLKITG